MCIHFLQCIFQTMFSNGFCMLVTLKQIFHRFHIAHIALFSVSSDKYKTQFAIKCAAMHDKPKHTF